MSYISLLSGTIIPWLLGTLLLLSFLALLVSMKLWRDMKRSPFFFMRQQAAKRLQSYLATSFVMLILAAAVGFYGWRAPTDPTPRSAVLSNTKPPKPDVEQLTAEMKATEAETAAVTASEEEPVAASGGIADLLLGGDQAAALRPQLPKEYDRYEPQVELNDSTELGAVALSTEVSDDYQALNPSSIFGEGFYTLYATFEYKEMADGLEWAWVWRHNGAVVDGGNELWAYGPDGPGYIYLSPEEGFQEGNYSLEIWVNGELLGQASATMNDAAVAAGR